MPILRTEEFPLFQMSYTIKNMLDPVPATEWHKMIAHDVSRGFRVLFGESPRGAPEKSAARPARILSPLRGYCYSSSATRGSRRRLFSVAAPRLLFAALIALFSLAWLPPAQAAVHKTQNVFLIISDGFRWQEVFNGAEEILMTKAKKFSYPGYNEILTGASDPRIDSNDKNANTNTTVFEWLNGRSGLRNRIAVFGTWDVFPYIFNIQRSQLPIWPVWESQFGRYEIPPPQFVADLLRDTTPMWDDLTYDSFLFHAANDYVKRKRPRLVFVGFGETDEWAHAGRYDHYLTAAHHMDDFVRRLWETAQSLPQYRDKTTFIITADHGRGSGPEDWKSHGQKIANSEGDWLAVIGPDTAPSGERAKTGAHSQSQIAATIAALLGEDYHSAVPQCGAPINDLLPGGEPGNTRPRSAASKPADKSGGL